MGVNETGGIRGCPGAVNSLTGWLLFTFLTFYNNLINLLPEELHSRIYVPVNLTTLFLLSILALNYLHLNLKELGYEARYTGRSIIWGLTSTLVVVSIFIILLLILPRIGIRIRPPEIKLGSSSELLYRLLIRIPFGTAFFEENLFRGIAYGYLRKNLSPKKTALITSILFGVWHIIPALKVVSSNLHLALDLYGVLLWCAGILGAFFAGILFAILRQHGKNITGCILCHALINDLALLAIYYLWK